MKMLCFSILLGSVIISFHYVWIKRIEIINANDTSSVIYNKWTGDHCVFFPVKSARDNNRVMSEMNVCKVDEDGKIEYP